MNQEIWAMVAAAITSAQAGESVVAVQRLEECWQTATERDEYALRCIIAHHLADLQTDVGSELLWDLRALESHEHVAPDGFHALGLDSVEQMLPSLHLNLGDAWFRIGDRARASHHLREGNAARHVLAEDGYGRMIRSGLNRLAERLEQSYARRD